MKKQEEAGRWAWHLGEGRAKEGRQEGRVEDHSSVLETFQPGWWGIPGPVSRIL